MNNAILWDLDGTIINTAMLHYDTWRPILKEYGKDLTYTEFVDAYGMNNTLSLTRWLGPLDKSTSEKLATRKESIFREHIPGSTILYPGVLAWLDRFKTWGIPQAIVSSAPMANIQMHMDDYADLRAYFDLLVSAELLPSKPDPAGFLKGARDLGVAPENCIVFEDAPAGVEGARRANMIAIGVAHNHSAQALKQAHLVIDSFETLDEETIKAMLNGGNYRAQSA